MNVNHLRVLAFFSTIFVVVTAGLLVGMYARGYRFDKDDGKLEVNGLLIVKSSPEGSQIYIDGELRSVTDDTISLEPDTYTVTVEREGYIPWTKVLEIKKEEVTEVTAHLFRSAPSLSAVTLHSATQPLPSYDFTKIAYAVLPEETDINTEVKQGLWILETLNLPLGFSRDPRHITDADLTDATWEWSPDGQEILLTNSEGTYLISINEFTPETSLINVFRELPAIRERWEAERKEKLLAQVRPLPSPIQELLTESAKSVVFSPDEEMVMYIASGSATLADDLISPIPGSSTQTESRELVDNYTYVYDIEEDRNFLLDENTGNLIIEGGVSPLPSITRRISWFPTSRNLILAQENKVIIMDYDGTNRQTVFAGGYFAPHAFPAGVSLDRIFILTNLGATSNLYSVGLK